MFSSIVWGIAAIATIYVTIAHYMPKLRNRIHKSEENSCSEIIENACNVTDTSYFRKYLFVILLCVCAACICGFRVGADVASPIMNLKICLGYCVLCGIVITDLEFMRIPNCYVGVLFGGCLCALFVEAIVEPEGIITRFISSALICVLCFLILFVVSKLAKGGLGEGDVKLFCGLAFLCGFYLTIYTLIFACLICGVVSIFLLLFKIKSMKDAVPMGPFILMGYILTILLAVY